uniref:Uncharacterized protein n=1 Tax=Arundo donax TaxID=35708 RepID=A0A0A8YL33_ARUDO
MSAVWKTVTHNCFKIRYCLSMFIQHFADLDLF